MEIIIAISFILLFTACYLRITNVKLEKEVEELKDRIYGPPAKRVFTDIQRHKVEPMVLTFQRNFDENDFGAYLSVPIKKELEQYMLNLATDEICNALYNAIKANPKLIKTSYARNSVSLYGINYRAELTILPANQL